jgi:hypothetical protein
MSVEQASVFVSWVGDDRCTHPTRTVGRGVTAAAVCLHPAASTSVAGLKSAPTSSCEPWHSTLRRTTPAPAMLPWPVVPACRKPTKRSEDGSVARPVRGVGRFCQLSAGCFRQLSRATVALTQMGGAVDAVVWPIRCPIVDPDAAIGHDHG